MSPRRTETGGRVDRLRTIRFTFDGAPYTGHAGDTLASALLANASPCLAAPSNIIARAACCPPASKNRTHW